MKTIIALLTILILISGCTVNISDSTDSIEGRSDSLDIELDDFEDLDSEMDSLEEIDIDEDFDF
jgi:uncharacterized protein YceK